MACRCSGCGGWSSSGFLCDKCRSEAETNHEKTVLKNKAKVAQSQVKAVKSVIEKHREAVEVPYLIPGGAAEVLKLFFRDIERVLED